MAHILLGEENYIATALALNRREHRRSGGG
jgi:hypothetical protein